MKYSKYEEELEKKLHPSDFEAIKENVNYSREYQIFKAEQISKSRTFYERACANAERLLKAKVKEKKAEDIRTYAILAHLNITPEGAYSFAYLMTIFAILGTVISFVLALLLFPSYGLFTLMMGMAFTLVAALYLPTLPKNIFEQWRAKASDQLLLAVLYLVIYMKREQNIERAVLFVSKHIPPPLSLDFMKVLWNFEAGVYKSVNESLDAYVETWKDKEDEFIQAIHLVESALYEPDQNKVKDLLEKGIDVVLEGTQDHMIHYAHSLQSPVRTLHMLGIVLPVLGMVMLPMIGAFMGELIRPAYLIVFYNIALPIIVFLLARQIVSTRPAGAATTDISTYIKIKSRPYIKVGEGKLYIPPKTLAIGISLIVIIPISLYVFNLLISSPGIWVDFKFSDLAFFMSIAIVAAVGFAAALYFWYSTRQIIDWKRKTEKVDEEFSSAIFQLGSRISEGVPAEVAFANVADGTRGTEVSKFFAAVDDNIRRSGLSLREAIFDPKVGAILAFPSSAISSIMNLFIEGAKKSPEVVADTLLTLSRYLKNVHRVMERLKDLLADTIANMQMQASFFAPLVAGIVVSLSVLITKVLVRLSDQMAKLGSADFGGAGVAGMGGMLSLVQPEHIMPSALFQLIVGVYIIQVVVILSYLLSNIINGADEIEGRWLVAKNLFTAIAIYITVTAIASFAFGQIALTVTAFG